LQNFFSITNTFELLVEEDEADLSSDSVYELESELDAPLYEQSTL
jgi:hypothetical protein